MLGMSRTVSCVLTLAVTFLLSGIRHEAYAQPSIVNPSQEQLLEKVRLRGALRVIVRLAVPGFAVENERVPERARAQREAIRQAQEALLRDLSSTRATTIHRYEFTPQMALEVDEMALNKLLTSPRVVAVQEDTASVPYLDMTGPLLGVPTVATWGWTGRGQAVAILDTGVERYHDFFGGRVVFEACYSTNSSYYGLSSLCPGGAEVASGPDSASPCTSFYTSYPLDQCAHGTHVAGIAAGGLVTYSGRTFSGVAREASILAVNVFSGQNDGLGHYQLVSQLSDQIAALQRIYGLRQTYRIAAVNMSLGDGLYSQPCVNDERRPSIQLLRESSIATIAATGNNYSNTHIGAPACIPEVISVSATDTRDVVANFANSNALLTFWAPGDRTVSDGLDGVLSSYSQRYGLTWYAQKSGTSAAAPHVSGALAVLRSKRPGVSVTEMIDVLKRSGIPVTDTRNFPPGPSNLTRPRIRVDKAIEMLPAAPITSLAPVLNLLFRGDGQ